jgi:hypothetical protein
MAQKKTNATTSLGPGPGLNEEPDPVILRLWDLGFALAGSALSLLGTPPNRPAGDGPAPAEPRTDLATQLHEFSERITAAIEDLILFGPPAGPGAGAERVETTKLQELQYRARSLVLLLCGDKLEEARRYSDMLAESITYLRGRLDENRPRWLGLWLGSRALHAVALLACGEPAASLDRLRDELRGADEAARSEALDRLVPLLSREGGVPWREVAAFTFGEPNQLVRTLLDRKAARHKRPDGPVELTRDEIREAVAILGGAGSSLYLAGSIPEKKLANARATTAADPSEDIVALLDCTVFGSAKDAVLFGSRNIYYFSSVAASDKPGRLAYHELTGCHFTVDGFTVNLGGPTQRPDCNLAGSGVSSDEFIAVLCALQKRVEEKQSAE